MFSKGAQWEVRRLVACMVMTPARQPRALWPVRGWALAEWALMPLRLFLGVTFTFAGLQKLANPLFFNAQWSGSVQVQFANSARFSPLHGILSHLVGAAKPLGILIALSEVAVGVGALLGLWTRVAAIGGALLSLTLFLTVSFHTSPYYTGADLVFLFAWLPLIIAGAGSRWSVDGWVARRVATSHSGVATSLVPVPFATIRTLCGNLQSGDTCKARGGSPCDASACPVLIGERPSVAARRHLDVIDRRTLVVGSTAAAAVAAGAVVLSGATADVGKLVGNATLPTSNSLPTTTSPATTSSVPGTTTTNAAKGTLLGPASKVPVGEAATFGLPNNAGQGIVFHTAASTWVAYNSMCTHAGCPVGYQSHSRVMVCPCHGSQFLVSTGAPVVGPAATPLAPLTVVEEADGNLYLR